MVVLSIVLLQVDRSVQMTQKMYYKCFVFINKSIRCIAVLWLDVNEEYMMFIHGALIQTLCDKTIF